MVQERVEMLLTTIDKLRATTIRQLRQIHDLGGYRNAAKVVTGLKPYINEYIEKEKIIYLNKEGRELIGSTHEVKYSPTIHHTLLTNEAYIHLNKPYDWKTEVTIEHEERQDKSSLSFKIGSNTSNKKKIVIADALFTRNGYVHLIEIDNIRKMQDNKKKIESYFEVWPSIKKEYNLQPILYFFTTTEDRKKKFSYWLNKKGIRNEVLTFDEIK